MPTPDPFALALLALLQPGAFAALLRDNRRMQLWAGLCALLWVGCVAALVWVIGRIWLALDGRAILVGLGLGGLLGFVLAAMAGQLTSASGGVVENAVFWAVRAQLTVTPCLALLTLGYVLRDPAGADDLLLALLSATLCGMLLCGALVVALLRLRERAAAAAVRWLLALAALIVAAELHWSGLLPPLALDLLTLFLAGCTAGLLRPLSWLWQAPLSLGLAVAAHAAVPLPTLRALHPV